MRIRNRAFVAAAVAMLVGVAVSGCASSADSASAGALDGRIIYAHSTGPSTLDPGAISSTPEIPYLNAAYDRLVYVDPLTRELKPMLATDWTIGSDSQGGYVDFILREGLEFPDGTPFTSTTVVANIDRSKSLQGSLVSVDLAAVDTVEAMSPNLVRVRSAGGAAWLPSVLSGPAGMMISENALSNTDLATKPVGIGMWTVTEFDPAKVTYEKTPDYWDAEAQASEFLELRFIADDNARFNAVQSGDIDLTFIRPSQYASAQAAGIDVLETSGATTYGLVFNTASPGLDNPKIRAALQSAIDREGIAKTLLAGKCMPTNQMFSPALPWNNPDIEIPPFDPKAAAESIAELAPDGGVKLRLLTADIDQYKKIAEVVQSNLSEVGVEVEIQIAPSTAVKQQFSVDKTADIALVNFGLEADPSQTVSRTVLPGGINNPGGYQNDAIIEKATFALGVSDQTARATAYQELSRLAVDGGTYIGICSPQFLWASDGGIQQYEGALGASLPEWRGVKG